MSLSSISGSRSGSSASFARVVAAAIIISMDIFFALASSAPRNSPGYACALFKLLPSAVTAAPASAASCVVISPTGLLSGKAMEFGAMDAIISFETMFGWATPMKMSLSLKPSASGQVIPSLFVISAICVFQGFILSVLPLYIGPVESYMTMSFIPKLRSIFEIAIPAAPAPSISTVESWGFLFVIFSAFISAASTMVAVPCWSSWSTGMSSNFWSFSSTSKHAGAAMSSSCMAP